MKKKRRRSRRALPEASYVCQNCGEEIVIPLDVTAGTEQEYVEDCPVCCHPQLIHVDFFEDGEVRAWAENEQDLN
jgi:DNA-directed RNA polymerase subunit RPC12/RpoP